MNDNSTLARIHDAAKAEFLERGFRQASLRSIVRAAGVTTGALYGYYDSKQALFAALVDEQYRFLMDAYRGVLNQFADLPPEEQTEQMGSMSHVGMKRMLRYLYAHRDEFLLLLRCSEGTRYASMTDELVELEVAATDRYCAVLSDLGRPVPPIDERLEHILVTGMVNAYFEIVLHEMPMDDAERYVDELHDFYTAGWMKIMGQ
jgi:AcrR family transcriptional regulator